MNAVYVLDPDRKPLMPTVRFGKVRRMLRSGQAVVVQTVPFTIQLTYHPKTQEFQKVTAGFDPGRTNIGIAAVREDGACLYLAHCDTRNRKIPKLMAKRKAHRQASRRGERLARKRLAKCLGTTARNLLQRVLPGCDKPLQVKDIINTEARFNNRLRAEGWMTPTATQLARTHINLLRLVAKILPVTNVVMEINKFAFLQLDNPGVKKSFLDFQHGPLYGRSGVEEAVSIEQNGICLLCKSVPIAHYHHIVPRSRRGSNTLGNLAGLCMECHKKVHTSTKEVENLRKEKKGLEKKYGGTSVLNQAIPSIFTAFTGLFPGQVYATNGWDTKQFRESHKLNKDHTIDAYCIAASILKDPAVTLPQKGYEILQFRRHDRSRIKRQTERTYYLGKKAVCKNRHKHFEQETDSLEEFALKNPDAIPFLTVKKSQRAYNDLKRYLPGCIILYEGTRYVLSGQSSGGKQYRFWGQGEKNFPVSECTVVRNNTGLVYAC